MTPSFETAFPHALEDLREGIRSVVAFRENPADRSLLELASDKIHSALKADPTYIRAVYYDAIVDDLQGKSNDAPPKYQRVLKAAHADARFSQEVRYNLGVAYYHGYSWQSLDKAIAEFSEVLRVSRDASLKGLAIAGRAQAYAMHLIPPRPTDFQPEPLL